MTTATAVSCTQRAPELLGQTVVLIGGSSGIGLETAAAARRPGAGLVIASTLASAMPAVTANLALSSRRCGST